MSPVIQLRGKLTDEEMELVGRALRSRWYWPKFQLRNAYGVLLIAMLVAGTIVKVISRQTSGWGGLAAVWLVLGGILWWVVVRSRKQVAAAREQWRRGSSDIVLLDEDGVRTQSADGTQSVRPWGALAGWTDLGRVALIRIAGGDQLIALPVGELDPAQRAGATTLLRAHLGEPSARGSDPAKDSRA